MTAPLRIELVALELNTHLPFHISRQQAPAARHSVQVRLIAEDGMEGWGEAPAIPYYGETRESLATDLPRLAEAALVAALLIFGFRRAQPWPSIVAQNRRNAPRSSGIVTANTASRCSPISVRSEI